MASLSFRARVPTFDANVGVGHLHDQPAPFETPDQLLAEMQRHGVKRALIYHRHGESISAFEGNRMLTRWSPEGGPFTYQWVASPDRHSMKQLRELHQDSRVTSVRLHNIQARYAPFSDWVYGGLMEWLQAERIPTWISLAETPAAELIQMLRLFPDLVTVFVGAHYVHAMLVRPLLRNQRHSYLELSRYEVLGELEALKQEFGAGRLIYGSYYPRLAMGPMLYYAHHMGLSQAELAAVCCGNLERVLGGQE